MTANCRLPFPLGAEVNTIGEDLAIIEIPLPAPAIPVDWPSAVRDVARRVYAGESNGEIAKARAVSLGTVNKQVAFIYRRLGVASRFELILRLRDGTDSKV